VLNRDLIEAVDARGRELAVRYSWVRGHDGHPVNEIVDALAQSAARGQPGPSEEDVLGALRAGGILRARGAGAT
jgi:ribonuclease HI